MGRPSGAARSRRRGARADPTSAASAPVFPEELPTRQRGHGRPPLGVYSHSFLVSARGTAHEPCESPHVSCQSWQRLGADDRAPARAGRARLHRAERHGAAGAGGLRHAGATPAQRRHGDATRPPVCRGRRSQQGQPELRGLGPVEQPEPDSQGARRCVVGRRPHRHPRGPRRRAPDHGDVLPEAESALARHQVRTRTSARCSRRKPTSRAS